MQNPETKFPLNILFDLDGTLTDPRKGILDCIRFALQELGAPIPPDKILTENIGPPLKMIFQNLLPANDARTIGRAIELYLDRYAISGMYENEVYPQIPEILAEFKRKGVRLYIATSKPTSIAGKIIDYFGLTESFTAIFGAEPAGELAAKPELIAHILSHESLKREETAMVGDRKYDIFGARVNGILPVGALWGFGSREELEAAGAELFYKHPSELSGLLPRILS